MIDLFGVVQLPLAIIGAVASGWYLHDRLFPLRRISWRAAERTAKKIGLELITVGFSPTVIVCVGRGGAVMGSLISGCLGRRPLIAMDRRYIWRDGRRIDDLLMRRRFPKALIDRPLVVSGDVTTGNTMQMVCKYLKETGAAEIRTACLYAREGAAFEVDHWGLRGTRDLRLPWMFTIQYKRDSRVVAEASWVESVSAKALATVVPPESLTIYLIRHGESEGNLDGDRFSGVFDHEVTQVGLRQSAALGKSLRAEPLERIYTSPLRRAVSTARVIQEATRAELVIDRRLREIDYGNWENIRHADVNKQWPEEFDAWVRDPAENHPGGGENPHDCLSRALGFMDELRGAMGTEGVKVAAVVTHRTVIRLLLTHFSGHPLCDYRNVPADNGGLSVLVSESGAKWQLQLVNQTHHLDQAENASA